MAKTEKETMETKASQPETVDAFIKQLKHPLKDVVVELRKIILNSDKNVGEEIYWNAPSFFYTGKMKPFNPKEYKRFIVVFNFFKNDCIRLIFLRGKSVDDGSGLMEGEFKDERTMAVFYSLEEVAEWKKDLQNKVKALVKEIPNLS